MASKRFRITDTFKENICGICGCKDINQYFDVNDNFIEYYNVYYSFREILLESLDIQIDHKSGKTMEICLDCKDKVIKFYHFKRKVKEVQISLKNNTSEPKEFSKNSKKQSKIVHDIYEIIENYTEKFSVSSIRVNENGKKLIIESSSNNSDSSRSSNNGESENTKKTPSGKVRKEDAEEEQQIFINQTVQQYESDIFNEPAVMIKKEPDEEDDLLNAIRYAHAEENDYSSEGMNVGEEDSYSNTDYFTASTSHHDQLVKRPRKDDVRRPNRRNSKDIDNKKKSLWHYAKRRYNRRTGTNDLQLTIIQMPRIVITDEMRSSQEIIKRFQKEMFSGRIQCYNDFYDMIQLDYAEEDELYLQHSRKFSRPEFQRVKRYQVECKNCQTKLWAQVKSTFAVKRHMEMCKKKSSIKKQQLDNTNVSLQNSSSIS
ncbi:hypothetical protein PVAND_001552 [Polypedilum vanderplanki]|uniref:ZAD domain-containing protein n=1 Tax=Polypedilum vanderplanki TaxID=319348 RepID=A0A9J6BNR7_POLVA|nr:hypothetical protein PVAND_001552 [Polypedilum vanderplanki]